MTEKQKRRIGKCLGKKRSELRRRHAARRARIAELVSAPVGDGAEDAQRDDIIDTQYSLEEMESYELQLLREAQDRLSQGGFGFCQRCGHPIAWARLLHMPETEYCYSCAVESERQERTARPGGLKTAFASVELTGKGE
jgi:DnaK suppressor protein